ncbi:MAG TPA: ribonuclease Y, partial [Porphyromonadaceae bacterium]|nr:ribonuclease Y [Porphyromonadaceae bacterium]
MDIVIGIIGLAIGAIVAWYLTGKAANSRAQSILSDAEKDAAVIKKKMLLEAKEETLSMQNEAEKQANSRLSKIQMTENRLKQREMTLNQKQEELNKKTLDIDEARVTLASQQEFMDKKAAEMERLHRQSVEKLETISGLSAQEAKERLVESLRDEAKTDAQSYVNDIMEEAKM